MASVKSSPSEGREPGRAPVPVRDEQSAAFWSAAAEHSFVLARCSHCGHYEHPPGLFCARCLRSDAVLEFVPVERGGRVRSWIVVHDSFLPGFEVPYVLVDVELDVQAGLRLIGRLVNGSDARLSYGDRVTVVFDDLAPGVAIPAFTLEARS